MADTVVAAKTRWSIAPYLIVDDVVATANYYRDELGFAYERFWNDAYVWVDDADALNAEFKSKGQSHARHLRPTLRVPRLRH